MLLVGDIELGSSVGESARAVHWVGRVRLWLGCPILAFRHAHWRLTCSLVWLWGLCIRAARSLLIETVVVVVILWQGPAVYKRVTGHSTSWVVFAVLLALAGFVTLLARSRRRTVFQDFPDCTAPDATGAIPGLSAYLANEVDRLGAIYRKAQRERHVTKGDQRVDDPIQPMVELDDTAEFLKDAVSPDAKLSFGPVSIPVGSILGIVARLMKGPQITGSLHREDDRLILLAHYEGPRPRSWRVQGAPGSAEADEKGRWNLYPLIEEMARRMLGDLTLGGMVKFRAIDAFTRAARASLEDGNLVQPSLLQQLEVRDFLLQAIAEDDSFDLAWYNLGVILLALDDKEMARSVFMRARSGNPDRWEATYALAVLPDHAATRMFLCDQLISAHPGPGAEARAYDLLGLLYTEQAESDGADNARELSKLAVANRRLAVRRAWRALRQAEWWAGNDGGNSQLEAARRLASTCLTNLAVCYKNDAEIRTVAQGLRRAAGIAAGLDRQAALMRSKSWENGQRLPYFRPYLLGGSAVDWSRRRSAHRDLRSRRAAMRQVRRPARQASLLLMQAGKLGPLDPRTHQELGMLDAELGYRRRAADQYSRALRVKIDDPEAWVALACTAAKVRRKQLLASQAAQGLLTLAPLVQPKQLKLVTEAIEGFDPEVGRWLRRLVALDGRIGQVIAGAKRGEQRARSQLDELTQQTRSLRGAAWMYYRCALARYRLEPPSSAARADENTVKELLQATERLDKECAPAVRRRNIHLGVAKTLADRGQVTAALNQAERAAQTKPFSPWAWQFLGDLCRRQTEYSEAESYYLKGLQWATYRDQLLALTLSLAACRLDRLQGQPTQSADADLLDTRYRLEQILELLKSSELWQRAKVHYWLGLVALSLNDGPAAITHFIIAAQPIDTGNQSGWRVMSILALSHAARALMKAGQLDKAQAAFDKVISAIIVPAPTQESLDSLMSVGLGESPTLSEVLIDARLGGAATRAAQGVDIAEARRLIELAGQQIPSLPEQARTRWTDTLEALLGQVGTADRHESLVAKSSGPPDQP